MLITTALLALYGRLLRLPILPAIEARLMMLPRFCAIIVGSTAWQAKNTPLALTFITASQCASPELRARALHHRGEVGARGDVGRDDARATPETLHLGGRALGPGPVQLGDDDASAHPRQLEGGGAADAAARAGDDRDLSLQLHA